MAASDWELLARVAVGFGLGFALGFERQLRGSPAGDRTFALVGGATAAVTAVTSHSSPQAVAGVVTGIGFIGAGVVFHEGGLVRGLTSAAAIFAAAAVGVVVGYGHLLLGLITAAGVLLTLELQYVPYVRWLDARSYASRFQSDASMDERRGPAPGGEPPGS